MASALPDEVGPSRTASTPPRYRRFLGMTRSAWTVDLTFLFILVLVAAPVAPTLYQSFSTQPIYEAGGQFTLGNYLRLFTDAGFGVVILNTALFAALSTLFSLLIAVPLAIIVEKTDIPGRKALGLSMQWPFFISALVVSFGWVLVYSPSGFVSKYTQDLLGLVPWNLYSIPGMALVEAVGLAPIAYFYCTNSLRQSDTSLEAAAQTVGASPLRILWLVVLPMLRPPIAYSAVLIFSMSVEALSVPLIIGLPNGIRLFSSFLYEYGLNSVNPDYGVLGAASVLILLVVAALMVVQSVMLGKSSRFVNVRGKAPRPYVLPLGRVRWIGVAVILLYLLVGAIIPLIALILRSFTFMLTPLMNPFESLTLENYSDLFTTPQYRETIVNSLIVSGVGALVVSFLATLAALIARRSQFRLRRLTEYLVLSSLAVPGIVLSIGLFWAFSSVPQAWGRDILLGTLLTLVIAFGIRALPLAFGSLASAIMQIHRELDDAARVSGADWVKTFASVLLRLLVPSFLSAIVLVFVVMMKEYAAAIFLATANTEIIGSTMLSLWAQGTTGPVAALAVVQVLICLAAAAIARPLTRKDRNA